MMKRQLTIREKTLATLAAVALGLFLLMQLFVRPLIDEWQATQSTLTTMRAKYLNALKIVRFAQGVGEKQRTVGRKATDHDQITALLRDIETAANDRVLIRRFQPLRVGNNDNRSSHTRRGRKMVRSLQVQIECLGKLVDLMAFFEKMEAGESLTRIKHFYLTSEGRDNGRLQCQLIVVRLLTS
ncbi:MAG: hypothetical protein ACE5HO_04195 [bacterium]